MMMKYGEIASPGDETSKYKIHPNEISFLVNNSGVSDDRFYNR